MTLIIQDILHTNAKRIQGLNVRSTYCSREHKHKTQLQRNHVRGSWNCNCINLDESSMTLATACVFDQSTARRRKSERMKETERPLSVQGNIWWSSLLVNRKRENILRMLKRDIYSSTTFRINEPPHIRDSMTRNLSSRRVDDFAHVAIWIPISWRPCRKDIYSDVLRKKYPTVNFL